MLISEIKKSYITESLKKENNLYDFSTKSLLVSITQMNNFNIIQYINEYLLAVFNDKNIKYNFSQEMQKLILLYIQNEKRNDERKNVIKEIIRYLNENKDIMNTKDACNFILGMTKINKDDNFIINEEDIKNILNEEFKNQINDLTKVNEDKNIDDNNKNVEEKKDNNNNGDDDEDDFEDVEG